MRHENLMEGKARYRLPCLPMSYLRFDAVIDVDGLSLSLSS
jgi:hypothetical protein